MKTHPPEITPCRRPCGARPLCRRPLWVMVAALALFLSHGLSAADSIQTFASPEEAVAALRAAVNNPDVALQRNLYGSATDDIIPSDAVQAKNEQTRFAAGLNTTSRLVRESETKYVLESGPNYWPFPVPIVLQNGRWFFDAAAGKEELVNRRVGRNELATLNTMRACVQAQREYSSLDRDGDEVLEFAQKFDSSPGLKDGLFWEPSLDGSLSPLGPLVAAAQGEGYEGVGGSYNPPHPYHGYRFKILTRQGKHTPGGKYDYVINSHMIGGFAFVAWPSKYGESGVMTFIVNQQGKVFQKDLGPKTASIVKNMTTYDPDKTWVLSND